MKLSTQAKLAVATIKALSPSELKEVVKAQFSLSEKGVQTSEQRLLKVMKQFFTLYKHGFTGCNAAVATLGDDKIIEAQDAVATLVQNTAQFLEENEETAILLAGLAKNLFKEAVSNTELLINEDESLEDLSA